MPPHRPLPQRHPVGMAAFDGTTEGVFFITLHSLGEQEMFGEVAEDRMQLNRSGEIVTEEWVRCVGELETLQLDEFIVMPNHLHAIVVLLEPRSEPPAPVWARPPKTVNVLVGRFRAVTNKRVSDEFRMQGLKLWDSTATIRRLRNVYDYTRTRVHIETNPENWLSDPEHPDNLE